MPPPAGGGKRGRPFAQQRRRQARTSLPPRRFSDFSKPFGPMRTTVRRARPEPQRLRGRWKAAVGVRPKRYPGGDELAGQSTLRFPHAPRGHVAFICQPKCTRHGPDGTPLSGAESRAWPGGSRVPGDHDPPRHGIFGPECPPVIMQCARPCQFPESCHPRARSASTARFRRIPSAPAGWGALDSV